MELTRARETLARSGDAELKRLITHIDTTPPDHTLKGMYISGLWEALASKGVSGAPPSVQQFKDYSLSLFMELLLDSTLTLFPRERPTRGLVRLGHLAIPTFASSIVGGVLMGTAGRNWSLALHLISRGYEVSLKPGKVTLADRGAGWALLQFRDVWNFGSSYQVGVIEGLMSWCNLTGSIVATELSPSSTDLRIEWLT